MNALLCETGSSSSRSVTTASNCQGRLTWLMRLAAIEEFDDDALEMERERLSWHEEVEEELEALREWLALGF